MRSLPRVDLLRGGRVTPTCETGAAGQAGTAGSWRGGGVAGGAAGGTTGGVAGV